MGNLKFKDIGWQTDKGLMYVVFKLDGDIHRWYPKWTDLIEIFNNAWATEGGTNNGKLLDYLRFSTLIILTREKGLEKVPIELIVEYNNLTEKMRQSLIDNS